MNRCEPEHPSQRSHLSLSPAHRFFYQCWAAFPRNNPYITSTLSCHALFCLSDVRNISLCFAVFPPLLIPVYFQIQIISTMIKRRFWAVSAVFPQSLWVVTFEQGERPVVSPAQETWQREGGKGSRFAVLMI